MFEAQLNISPEDLELLLPLQDLEVLVNPAGRQGKLGRWEVMIKHLQQMDSLYTSSQIFDRIIHTPDRLSHLDSRSPRVPLSSPWPWWPLKVKKETCLNTSASHVLYVVVVGVLRYGFMFSHLFSLDSYPTRSNISNKSKSSFRSRFSWWTHLPLNHKDNISFKKNSLGKNKHCNIIQMLLVFL